MYGESSVREVALATGRVLREKSLAHSDFGEGLVKVGSRCVALPAVPCLAQQGHQSFPGASLAPQEACLRSRSIAELGQGRQQSVHPTCGDLSMRVAGMGAGNSTQ